jgi:dTMP kinase
MLMQQPANHGVFLTIEGVEGVGKSTAVRYIQQYLTAARLPFVVTREPGGTPIAEKIRQLLLAPNAEEPIIPITELLLMFACRAQHVANLIMPALTAGKWVVSDRFVDASYAYQGAGRGFDMTQIATLDEWTVGSLHSQATILLDAPPQLGLTRIQRRGQQDRIEQEKVDFFERVRAGYLQRAKNDAQRFHVIDATQPLAVVHAEIKIILDKLILSKQVNA